MYSAAHHLQLWPGHNPIVAGTLLTSSSAGLRVIPVSENAPQLPQTTRSVAGSWLELPQCSEPAPVGLNTALCGVPSLKREIAVRSVIEHRAEPVPPSPELETIKNLKSAGRAVWMVTRSIEGRATIRLTRTSRSDQLDWNRARAVLME